jgi:hypothetical protein
MKTDKGKAVKKENLPSKMCPVCNRPFTWRKKWEKCWDEVTTCSKSCNFKRKEENQKARKRCDDGNNEDEDKESGDLKKLQGRPLSSTSAAMSSAPGVIEELSRLTVVADEKQDVSKDHLLAKNAGIYFYLIYIKDCEVIAVDVSSCSV